MKKDKQTLDASLMVNSSNSLERQIGNQIDGYTVWSSIAARIELLTAAKKILKIGTIDKVILAEAQIEWQRINHVLNELGLNE